MTGLRAIAVDPQNPNYAAIALEAHNISLGRLEEELRFGHVGGLIDDSSILHTSPAIRQSLLDFFLFLLHGRVSDLVCVIAPPALVRLSPISYIIACRIVDPNPKKKR